MHLLPAPTSRQRRLRPCDAMHYCHGVVWHQYLMARRGRQEMLLRQELYRQQQMWDGKVRSLPLWPLRLALRQHRIDNDFTAPKGYAKALKNFVGTPLEQELVRSIVIDIDWLRRDRRNCRQYISDIQQMQYRRRDRRNQIFRNESQQLLACLHAKSAFKLWHRIQVNVIQRTEDDVAIGIRIEDRVVEMVRIGRHYVPHTQLWLNIVAPRKNWEAMADGFRVGPWVYRRAAGRKLALEMRYIPQGLPRDHLNFTRERNMERRRMIVIACGDELVKLLPNIRLMQADDYGELYGVHDGRKPVAQYVRVICPSTRRVYWLRTQSHVRTARAAVADTFQLREQDYQPAQET